MREVFYVEERFACRLWRHLDVSPTLLWQIGQCDTNDVSREQWLARMRRLVELLNPRLLLEASLAVHPENGKPRAKEAVDFEDAILVMTDRNGEFRWWDTPL